jgi:predicted nucleotidyltransferase/transcriptional regulator with XRE-family HTH domain
MKIDATKLRGLVKSNGLTNTKVAAQAGITRQALQSMLRQDHVVDVRERTVKGLAQALRLPDASLLSPDPLVGYKEAVAEQNADLTFRGLGLPTTESRSMDDLYVPVRVVRIPEQEGDDDCRPPMAETEDAPFEESDKLTVAQCLGLHRRVLICGEPGSGKSTALRHVARAYAQGFVTQGRFPRQPRLPLMLRLADFGKARERDADMTLVRFVVTCTLRDASAEYWTLVERNIELELQKGTCLVLLDGLDEVGRDTDLLTVLRRFVEDFAHNQFVLTSRIVGLDAAPWRDSDFAMFKVSPWREEEIREFARRWYAGRRPLTGQKQPKKQLDQRADEFAGIILNHSSLREIASNPLMLTILAALHHANATLPRRRVELYAKIVEVMLETWEASKREARPGDSLHGIVLEAREFGWLLGRLALGMQREGRILRPRWWVNDLVQQFLRDQMALDGDCVKEQGERVIRYLCERAGLLVERGEGVFGFCHRTFQEYFAARGLLLEAEGEGEIVALLRPYLFHPQWEEVIVHVAASLSALRATALMRVILDDPDPAGRFLRRSQRLALRCLVDGAAVADRAVLDQVFSDAQAIGRSRWLGITMGVISLLQQLLFTRHEAAAQRMLNDIEGTAKKELSDDGYLAVYLSSHGLPNGPRDAPPGTICRKRLGGRQLNLTWAAWQKRIEDPDSWYAEVLKSVCDPNTEIRRRKWLISVLGQEADSNEKARHALKERLRRDHLAVIRAASAEALEEAVFADPKIVNLLLERLDKDRSDTVRASCAEALSHVAPNDMKVRVHLEKLFASGPDEVRVGVARGLSRLDFTLPEQKALLDRILTTIASSTQAASVRFASIGAISSLLGRDNSEAVDHLVEECLDDQNSSVRIAALHALADAIAEGRRKWSRSLVEKIETMLMAVTDPCRHLVGDLVSIVAMKEMHGGRRVDRLLGDALMPIADRITIAFIFGSVARQEQSADSDIDVMILGDVRLKDVATALHGSEQTLGRAVNPVLYAPEKFREQYREGNPFLLDVYRKEKIFLKGNHDELTELVADRSPD